MRYIYLIIRVLSYKYNMTIYVLARERRKMTDDQNSSKKIKVPSLRQDPGGGTFFMVYYVLIDI